jgi:transposase, IS30 family
MQDGTYRPPRAQAYVQGMRKRYRRWRLFKLDDWLYISKFLRKKWRAKQIAATLKLRGELDISYRTIYRQILRDKAQGGTLWEPTRIISKFGRKRYRSIDHRGIQPDKRHGVLTRVERKTGFAIVKKLSSRCMAETNEAAVMAISEHRRRFKTITFDNETEFHDYRVIEMFYRVKCYFATPYHSWERGSNENFNGLLGQYFPKGMCMSTITQADCDEVARQLNMRPRKRLGFKPPHSEYYRN